MTTLPHFPSVNILNGEKKKKRSIVQEIICISRRRINMHLQYLDKNPSLSVSTGLTIFVTHGLSFSFRNDYTIFFFF